MARKWVIALLSALIVFGGLSLSKLLRRPSAPPGVPSQEWIDFSPEGGGFRISMPGTPSRQQASPTPWGSKVDAYQLDRDEYPARFYVFWYDTPADPPQGFDPDHFVDTICQGIAKEHRGEIRSKQAVRLDGHPVRRFLLETPERAKARFHTIRVCFTGKRLIVAAVVTPESQVQSEHVDKFLNSLALVQ
jgi:hypothetical protein